MYRPGEVKRFDFAPGRRVASKYEIERPLGSGYHGDIHDDNIMIRRQGITFDVKLLDFFDLGRPTRSRIHKDVLNLIQVFHTIVGGRDQYAKQPSVVKDVIRGLKDSLIL